MFDPAEGEGCGQRCVQKAYSAARIVGEVKVRRAVRKLLVHTTSLAFGSRHRKKPTDSRATPEKRKQGFIAPGSMPTGEGLAVNLGFHRVSGWVPEAGLKTMHRFGAQAEAGGLWF